MPVSWPSSWGSICGLPPILVIASWYWIPPQFPVPAVSTVQYLDELVATLSTVIISTLLLNRLLPKIPVAWLIFSEPDLALSAVKENDANPPHNLTLELNLADASTTKLFLTLVVPPWPAIVMSEALVAKLSILVLLLPPKKLTVPAVVVRFTVSSSSLEVPSCTSPAILSDLVLIWVYDNVSLLPYAPPISTLEILVIGVFGVVPRLILLW